MSMTAHITTPPPMTANYFTFPSSSNNTPNGTILNSNGTILNNESNDYFSKKINQQSISYMNHQNEAIDSIIFHSKINSINSINSVESNFDQNNNHYQKNTFNLDSKNESSSISKSNFKNLRLDLQNSLPNANHKLLTPISAIENSFNINKIEKSKNIENSIKNHNSDSETLPSSSSQSVNNQYVNFKPPALLKHTTISGYYTFDKSKIKKNEIDLPPNVTMLSCEDAARYINTTTLDIDNLPNFLIVDVRPFTDYIKSHIKNSLNFAIPTTLLKRPNYKLDQCINSLSHNEKLIFENFHTRTENYHESDVLFKDNLNNGIPCGMNGLPSILLYDNSSSDGNINSMSLSCMAKKFIANSDWNSPIFILQGGFNRFNDGYNELTESGINQSTKNSPMSEFPNDKMKLSFHANHTRDNSNYSSSPVLSKFILPEPKSIFKIRHHEEIFTSTADSSISLNTNLNELNNFEKEKLPNWFLSILKNCLNNLNEKFNELELKEKNRLDSALCSQRAFNISQCEELGIPDVPSISGVELGSKNRYPDMFLYEHSRVKLNPVNSSNSSDCDYINASYINYPETMNKYIATQGPLPSTVGDFWRIAVEHKCPIVLSLTAEYEGGAQKCAPYWKSGTYYSNNLKISIDCVETDENIAVTNLNDNFKKFNYNSDFIIRRIKIFIEDEFKHEVLQLHVPSWPDLGSFVKPNDLLSLVFLKKHLMSLKPEWEQNPVIVHCSAGCGRTGTFCAIDSVIDILTRNSLGVDCSSDYDPIYSAVDFFRKQRISMVQNLRQYLLIYDSILVFLRSKVNKRIDWNNYSDLEIIKNFVRSSKLSDTSTFIENLLINDNDSESVYTV